MTDIDRLDARINRLGASLFFDPVTLGHGADHGIADAMALYVGGRAGALGDVTLDVVVTTFGFLHPDLLAPAWDALPVAPSRAAAVLAEGMAAAARSSWDAGAAEVVARLGREVIDAVTPLGLPLFTAWRTVAGSADPADPGGAAIVVMTLRELRGDVNVQSVAGAGLHPLEAEMATRGAGYAELHGWPRPWPDPEPHRAALAAADAVTHRRMAAAYAVLGDRLSELDAAVATLAAP